MRSERLPGHIHEVIFRGMAMLPVHQLLGARTKPYNLQTDFPPSHGFGNRHFIFPSINLLGKSHLSGEPQAEVLHLWSA